MNTRHFVLPIIMFAAGCVISSVIGGRSLFPSVKLTEPAVTAQVTQNPSTSQRWEYRVLIKSRPDRKKEKAELEYELNSLVEQGFEVSWVTQSSTGASGGWYLTIVLRRPKY
jgi:hypothetical protein